MENSASFDWQRFKSGIHQALLTFPHFLKNPIDGMRHMPDWDWPTLCTLQGGFAVASGFISEIVAHRFLEAALAFFIAPLVAIVVNFVLSGFFYYVFMFSFKKTVEFRHIYTHFLFASIPVLFMALLAPIVPFVHLVGAFAACILLIVGFSNNFGLPVKPVRNLMFLLFFFYSGWVVFEMINLKGSKEKLRLKATPQSLDILEKELKEDSE